jgi:hypothetical protein
MKLAIIGSGNVASATAMELARGNSFQEIVWVARNVRKAEASLKDVISVFPSFVQQVRLTESLHGEYPDIVVVAAGVHVAVGQATRLEARDINAAILLSYVSGNLKKTSIVVIVASPVDELTALAAKILELPIRQIMGFGGDLDFHRLEYALGRRGRSTTSISVIGEHGPRAIPVYPGEFEYGIVAHEVRHLLADIWSLVGRPRNLATGVLLGCLLRSLLESQSSRHHVTTYCPDYEEYLTWPSVVSGSGVVGRQPLQLGPSALLELGNLLRQRKHEGTTNFGVPHIYR